MTDTNIVPFSAFTYGFYEEFVRSRVKWLGSPVLDLHHATTGLVGEVIELYAAEGVGNVIEELGDCYFYLTAAWMGVEAAALPVDIEGTQHAGKVLPELQYLLLVNAGIALDCTKKGWIYNKPLAQTPLVEAIVSIELCLDALAEYFDEERLPILYRNYVKLMKRYPLGYTDAAAQARADKVEEPQNG